MQDVELVKAAIMKAGEVALSHFKKAPAQWHKSDGSLLTAADLAVNEALHQMLSIARPEYGWLSEEGPADPTRTQSSLCWILDPIDGTRTFALGRHEWCIGLCLALDSRPIISAVLQPSTRQLYFAQYGKGATVNGQTMTVRDADHLQGATLAARGATLKRFQGAGFTAIDVLHTPLITRLAMLAEGSVDVVLSLGWKHDWDLAPGALLVSEAGGRITTEHGAAMVFNQSRTEQQGIIAAGQKRHAQILKFMEQS